MAEDRDGPDSIESMAFQLLLQKMTSLERAMESLPPLLKKIIDQLEAQTKQPDVEVATYAQLYPELEEPATLAESGPEVPSAAPLPERPRPPRGWRRWFVREEG